MSSAAPSSKHAFQTILAGRKCYRMSKDKNEVVWPPHLEAALMEGLEKYAPAESKSPRGLTRFPNRNKFIAEHIRKKTGEIRTAKQVGSRIQQLRDTSAGKHIMKAISDRHYEMMHPTRQSQGPADLGFLDGQPMLLPVNDTVHVYISVPSASLDAAGWQLQNGADSYGQPSSARQTEVSVLSPSAYQWLEPRSLRSINPTVYFRSSVPLALCSTFSVFCGSTVMYVDPAAAMGVREAGDPLSPNATYLYYASLTPGYWETLCTCTDLSQYTIVQEITKQPNDPITQKPAVVMVINYHFNTSPAPPLSPFSLSDDEFENIDYEAEELLHGTTCSDSPRPYSSDRGSSPAYSTAPGFQSVPLSPADWNPHESWAFGSPSTSSVPTTASTGTSTPLQYQSAAGYYSMGSHAHGQAQYTSSAASHTRSWQQQQPQPF